MFGLLCTYSGAHTAGRPWLDTSGRHSGRRGGMGKGEGKIKEERRVCVEGIFDCTDTMGLLIKLNLQLYLACWVLPRYFLSSLQIENGCLTGCWCFVAQYHSNKALLGFLSLQELCPQRASVDGLSINQTSL